MNQTNQMSAFGRLKFVCGIAAAVLVATAATPAWAQAQTAGQSDLRATLTTQLAEHSLLAGNATGALIGNRLEEYQAASAALVSNTDKTAGTVSTLAGRDIRPQFVPLWQRHIQHYVDYTNATKGGDEAGRVAATEGLLRFSREVGGLLSTLGQRGGAAASSPTTGSMAGMAGMAGSAPGTVVPAGPAADMWTEMMQVHALGTLRLIDAQAAGNFPLVYSLAGADIQHMKMVAQMAVDQANAGGAMPMTMAMPAGEMNMPAAADMRSDVALLLVENASLNANASGALIGNRIPEYQAASAALRDNTAALSSMLGAVYGGNTYTQTTDLWSAQNLRLAQYANALVNQDAATQSQARFNALGFGQGLAQEFNAANVRVPAATIDLWGNRITAGALNLIDAQRAQNFAEEYRLRAQTNQTLLDVSDRLVQAINRQFPNRFTPSDPLTPVSG